MLKNDDQYRTALRQWSLLKRGMEFNRIQFNNPNLSDNEKILFEAERGGFQVWIDRLETQILTYRKVQKENRNR
jgi:hypothetical protein